jgi:CheY-like chemotaxis protein
MLSVLIVDDTALERRRAGALLEKPVDPRDFPVSAQLQVLYAANGSEALAQLRQARPDLIVTDLMMPEVSGLELVQEVHDNFPSVPVILMTAHGSEDIAALALQVGAAGYVPKKHLVRDLRDTVENVLSLVKTDREEQSIWSHVERAETQFVLPLQLTLIPSLVAHLQTNLRRLALFDHAEELRVTVALREALVNAIAHGSLEGPRELRESDPKGYRQVLEERSQQAPYRDRRVFLRTHETHSDVCYVIRDEGPGFDVAQLPDPTDTAQLASAAGRGILLMRTFMDEVSYNPIGNEVTMIKRSKPAPRNGKSEAPQSGEPHTTTCCPSNAR